jgi:hypothetical protein
MVRVDREHAWQLVRLRATSGLEVAETADALWLRAPAGVEAMDRLLLAIDGDRFQPTEDGQLVPWGKRVPSERLPRLRWQPLAQWSTIALPVAALPGQPTGRVRLQLVRGGGDGRPSALCTQAGRLRYGVRGGGARRPSALVTDCDRWLAYASTAAEVRLKSLAFALSQDRRVLIVGWPLPPVAGQAYVVDAGIATPCGWSISPNVGSDAIRKLLLLDEGDVALFAADGSFERIAAEHFVKGGRGAARASAEVAAHG